VLTILLTDRKRVFAIPISESEMMILQMVLESKANPLTLPRILCQVVDSLGGNIEAVLIHDLRGEDYGVKMALREGIQGEVKEVEVRPADAIAISHITGAPIYAANDILEKVSVDASKIKKGGE